MWLAANRFRAGLLVMASLLVNARGQLSRMIHSHCTSAALLAERMGLDADVQQALGFTFERFDGGGLPGGVRGDDIPIAIRVAQLSDMVEVHHRDLGVDRARSRWCRPAAAASSTR